jgi:hypothetical protein
VGKRPLGRGVSPMGTVDDVEGSSNVSSPSAVWLAAKEFSPRSNRTDNSS